MTDERKFADVVRSIATSEEDVDKILNAAKLDRHEAPSTKLSASQKMELIFGCMILIGILGFFSIFAFIMTL